MAFRREHKIIAAAAIVGLTVAGGLWWVDKASVKLVPIVIAARDLDARHTIQASDLKTIAVPPSGRDNGAVHDPDQLVGKSLISPVFSGEQFRQGRVTVGDRELGADEVAFALRTDLTSAVGGLLNVGDMVDLYLVPGDANGQPAQGRKVEVFKVGEGYRVFSIRDSNAKATGDSLNSDPSRTNNVAGVPAVVVLKVPTDHVAGLRQATALGVITFVKRSPNAPTPERPTLIPLPATVTQIDVRGVPLSTVPAQPTPQPTNQPGAPAVGQTGGKP